MSKLSMSVFLAAYQDKNPSNAPNKQNFKWYSDLNTIPCSNPQSDQFTIYPGQTITLFNGTRTINQDNTTQYSIAPKPSYPTTYVLSWAGGTQPNFRTPRALGTDATTQITTTQNGPVETFTITSAFATYATFTGLITGMTSPITLTANTIGTTGNSIVLTADGTSSISTLITNWNTAHPSNQVTLTSGDGTQMPAYGTYASYTGTPLGTTLPITITANNVGSVGNSVVLTGDGTSQIDVLIGNWNTANPSNQITQTAGINTQTPAIGATIQLSGGEAPDTIQLSGGTAAQPLNLITSGVVVGDYVTIGTNFNSLNQGTFQIIALTATSFSVNNSTGVAEGPITLGSNYATQLQIYSAAGVQAGDTLDISSGFSPVTQGNYLITAVYAESLEFSSTAVLPTESNILTEVNIYSAAKQLIYMESGSNISLTINGNPVGTIEPFVLANCNTGSSHTKPGVFMIRSTIYSLGVTNSGTNPAEILLISIE